MFMLYQRSLWFVLLLLGLLLGLLLALSGGQHAQAATPTPASTPTLTPTPAPATPVTEGTRVAAGRQVYLQNYCGICHTLAAAGTHGAFGPPHDGIAATARQRLADPDYSGKAVTVIQCLSVVSQRPTLRPATPTRRTQCRCTRTCPSAIWMP